MHSAATETAPRAADASRQGGSDESEVLDLAWYVSSFELRQGLTVVEVDFADTVPGEWLLD